MVTSNDIIWDDNNNNNNIITIFLASLRSIGTACTLASAGVYLHRRGYIVGDGKRTLALISQQVTIPLLFFTKIIYCNQYSDEPCPDVTKNLQDVWMLMIWPFYVVSVGICVGYAASYVSQTPRYQRSAVLAACGFGNSTGLPITLLAVIHAHFPKTRDLGRIDPTLFLSVYLLIYPALQWGIGGWLLATPPSPKEEEERLDIELQTHPKILTTTTILSGDQAKERLVESTFDKSSITTTKIGEEQQNSSKMETLLIQDEKKSDEDDEDDNNRINEHISLLQVPNGKPLKLEEEDNKKRINKIPNNNSLSRFFDSKIIGRFLKPPVIGALLGLFVTSIPFLRGIFVDLDDRNDDAPLEWFFDGLYVVGQAAVPINMIILGVNLSASYQSKKERAITNNNDDDDTGKQLFSNATTFSIVIAKLLVMPAIGFISAYLFRTYLWNIPDDIDGSFYLVILIVFLTPTANNVMVMVELSGSNELKKGIARVIAWQYAAGPFLITFTLTVAVGIADRWS